MAKPTLDTYGGTLLDWGYPGQIATSNPTSNRDARNIGTIAIQFGSAVARGAADYTCKAPTADADQILGIAIRHVVMVADISGNVAYLQNATVPILLDGDIYASPVANVVAGDGVISVTAGNGTLSGTTAGAAGAGRVAVPGATWETTTAAGQIGLIRIKN